MHLSLLRYWLEDSLPWEVIIPIAYAVIGSILLLATADDLIPDEQKERKR